MLTWEERIERVKEACSIKNNRKLEERLGLANGYINDLLKGKNKNPGKLAAALMKELGINPLWFEDETLDIFGRIDFEKLAPPNPPVMAALEKFIKEVVSDDFSRILIRLSDVEKRLGMPPKSLYRQASLEETLAAMQHRGENQPKETDNGSFTAEPAPEYDADPLTEILYAEDIAAGPPIAQSEDQSQRVAVPARLVRKEGRYYAASIRGTSMSEAGIRDGDPVLIRQSDVPRDGAIQVVRYQGRSTLKRLRQSEGKGWELHYEDGSGRVIPVDSGDCLVQGDFVAVLPENTVPAPRKKGRQRGEKPLENR